MKSSIKNYSAMVLLALAAAGTMMTSSAYAKGSHGFDRLDTNKDGFISPDEARGHSSLERNFDALDTNKDGKLSRAEIKAGKALIKADRAAHKDEKFNKADLNKDGKLSRDEFAAAHPKAAKKFDSIDANKDGFITKDELTAWHAAHKGRKS